MNRRNFTFSILTALASLAGAGYIWRNRWEYIVIHHSAGSFGDIDFLQKVHRERQSKDPIDAIPYHYIIGNGNGLEVGEIASDWRGDLNIWGAHVSRRNSDRNTKGIGICVIGNYEEQKISSHQYEALIKLTKKLMAEHKISVKNVTGHGYIPGEQTKCPGKFFPMGRFKRDIA